MSDQISRNRLWQRLDRAVRHAETPPEPPVFVVDLDAFDANADDLQRRAAGTPIRLATKSVRVPDLIARALARPGFSGVLCYSLREALFLHEREICDDLVVAYPSLDRRALERLASSPSAAAAITVMIDEVGHLDVIDSLRWSKAVPIRVAIDVDAGLRMATGVLGPRRSPLFATEAVTALAREVVARPGFTLVGVMTYEGQVAGVPDEVPGQRARSAVVRRVKAASLPQLAERRAAISAALSALAPLEFFNAGGTGSIETTVADPSVTEVAAGSGLVCPGLFDHYRSFTSRPAAFYGVPVVRRPSATTVTVAGGGYIASGAAGTDRLPLPWAPAGLALTSMEGAGEVQTPLTGDAAGLLSLGDLVWFRHAKSGELFEHAGEVQLLSGDALVSSSPTYRGLGRVF